MSRRRSRWSGSADRADATASRLSGGQRRRLDVAMALIGNPELVFLDEPTTGFDPSARRAAWEMIPGLRATGVTVFLTTHYMDEAEHLADRVAVIAAGRIVAEGTPETLGGRDRCRTARSGSACPTGATLDGSASVDAGSGRGPRRRPGAAPDRGRPWPCSGRLSAGPRPAATDLADLEVRRPSLEDMYLALTEPVEDDETDG